MLGKGIGFDSWRRIGSVLPAIKVYNLRVCSIELIVSTMRPHLKKGTDYKLRQRISA
jgi:cyclase